VVDAPTQQVLAAAQASGGHSTEQVLVADQLADATPT
jgi:hypothetical protein